MCLKIKKEVIVCRKVGGHEMGTWPERALHILTIYHERGLKALSELEVELYDDADTTLTKRKAAFHNFRAVDHRVRQEGYPEPIWLKLVELWKAIEPVDQALMEALLKAKRNTQVQLAQISKVRAALSRFKGRDGAESSSFEKSV
jgi:hypothetical protein